MIYFIQAGSANGPIKIGFTKSIKHRFASLQSGHADKLFLLGVMEGGFNAEAAMHKLFQADRINGEWFRSSADMTAFIRANTQEPSAEQLAAETIIAPAQSVIAILGKNVFLARKRRRLSRKEVAERAGVSVGALIYIEKGSIGASLGTIVKVLQVFDLHNDIALVGADDIQGYTLEDTRLSDRRRSTT